MTEKENKSVAGNDIGEVIEKVVGSILGQKENVGVGLKEPKIEYDDVSVGRKEKQVKERVKNTNYMEQKSLEKSQHVEEGMTDEFKTPEDKVTKVQNTQQVLAAELSQWFADPNVLNDIEETCEKAERAQTFTSSGGSLTKNVTIVKPPIRQVSEGGVGGINAPSFSIGLTQIFEKEALGENYNSAPNYDKGTTSGCMQRTGTPGVDGADVPDRRPGKTAKDAEVLFPNPLQVIYDPNYVFPADTYKEYEQGRGKRIKKVGKACKSPYVHKSVNVDKEPNLDEKQAAYWLFTTFGMLG